MSLLLLKYSLLYCLLFKVYIKVLQYSLKFPWLLILLMCFNSVFVCGYKFHVTYVLCCRIIRPEIQVNEANPVLFLQIHPPRNTLIWACDCALTVAIMAGFQPVDSFIARIQLIIGWGLPCAFFIAQVLQILKIPNYKLCTRYF